MGKPFTFDVKLKSQNVPKKSYQMITGKLSNDDKIKSKPLGFIAKSSVLNNSIKNDYMKVVNAMKIE